MEVVKNTPATETPATETPVTETQAPAEPKSELLTKLQTEAGELAAVWQGTKYGTKEYNDAKLAMLKKEKEIDAEITAIRKLEAEAKIAELRNARIKLATDYKAAVLANTGKGANDATKQAELDAETALHNALLPNNAKVAAEPKEGAGTKGATSQQIESELRSRIDGGMPVTDAVNAVIALGFSRGTVGTVRTKFWPAK